MRASSPASPAARSASPRHATGRLLQPAGERDAGQQRLVEPLRRGGEPSQDGGIRRRAARRCATFAYAVSAASARSAASVASRSCSFSRPHSSATSASSSRRRDQLEQHGLRGLAREPELAAGGSKPKPSWSPTGRAESSSSSGTTGRAATRSAGSPTRTARLPRPASRARCRSLRPAGASSATTAAARQPSAAPTARLAVPTSISESAAPSSASARAAGGIPPVGEGVLERRQTLAGERRTRSEFVAGACGRGRAQRPSPRSPLRLQLGGGRT